MSSRPAVKGSDAIRAFTKYGFALARVRGSHHILRKPGHRFVLAVPVHAGRTLGKGLLASLITAAGLTEDEFFEALKTK